MEEMRGVLTDGVVCVGGPSGAGKDTIVSAFLQKHHDYVRVPRCTTRTPRPNEIPGIDYIFLSEEEFSREEKAGLIRGVDHYCGKRYGICAVELRKVLPVILFYITAPIPVLEERLQQRGHSPDEIRERLEAARQQWQRGDPQRFDYTLENTGTVAQGVHQLSSLLLPHRLKVYS